jgi:hypothetical protein
MLANVAGNADAYLVPSFAAARLAYVANLGDAAIGGRVERVPGHAGIVLAARPLLADRDAAGELVTDAAEAVFQAGSPHVPERAVHGLHHSSAVARVIAELVHGLLDAALNVATCVVRRGRRGRVTRTAVSFAATLARLSGATVLSVARMRHGGER